MKLQNQVCSLEQAKRLNELGIIQGKSAFFYDSWMADKNKLQYNSGSQHGEGYKGADSCYSAFTVAELGVMMPDLTYSQYLKGEGVWIWLDCGTFNVYPEDDFTRNTEAESRADAIIYLLEQERITAGEINNRLQNL